MLRTPLLFAIVATANLAMTAQVASALPPGFTIPKITISPDKQFGILVPDLQHYDPSQKNKLVEVSTGRVLAAIAGEPAMEHMSHGNIDPTRWSTDSSLLLWRVEGKWFPHALVLIKLDNEKVLWQLNL